MLNKEEQEYKNKILAETNEEEQEYKQKILQESNEEKLEKLVYNKYVIEHWNIINDEEVKKHINKYMKPVEEPDFLPYYKKK